MKTTEVIQSRISFIRSEANRGMRIKLNQLLHDVHNNKLLPSLSLLRKGRPD